MSTKPRRTAGPNPVVSQLLNHAYEQAAMDCVGLDATEPKNLRRLERAVRENIGYQVGAGMWQRCGITDPDQLANMSVSVRLGNTLIGEPPIVIDTSFVGTPLALVTVESVPRPKGHA